TDKLVKDPRIVALRDRVTATVDPVIQQDQVRITITLKDGRKLEKYVEHVVSSVKNPMSDAQLDAKFLDLADGILPKAQARKLLGLCRDLEKLDSAAQAAKAAAV